MTEWVRKALTWSSLSLPSLCSVLPLSFFSLSFSVSCAYPTCLPSWHLIILSMKEAVTSCPFLSLIFLAPPHLSSSSSLMTSEWVRKPMTFPPPPLFLIASLPLLSPLSLSLSLYSFPCYPQTLTWPFLLLFPVPLLPCVPLSLQLSFYPSFLNRKFLILPSQLSTFTQGLATSQTGLVGMRLRSFMDNFASIFYFFLYNSPFPVLNRPLSLLFF